MKSEKGVTIASIMIYVVALTIVVIMVGRITTYFYKNINAVSTTTGANAEYTKFNSYFTDEINIEGNDVVLFSNTDEESYIVFSGTENQYTFKKGTESGGIYRGKVKICKNIESCIFNYDETTGVITVELRILGKNYSNQYTIVK